LDKGIGNPGESPLCDSGGKEFVSVIFKDENWGPTQNAMGELFDGNASAASRHLQNIYEAKALSRDAAVSKAETISNGDGRSAKHTLRPKIRKGCGR